MQVVRFWAQHVMKLVSVFVSVRHSVWSSLAALLAHMHAHLPPVGYVLTYTSVLTTHTLTAYSNSSAHRSSVYVELKCT